MFDFKIIICSLHLECNSINIYNCSAYGDIILDTNYSNSIYDALNGTTIYRNGIEKYFFSIRKPDVRTATLSANGGVLTVTKHKNPFIANIDVTDVTDPLDGTKVGDFKYKVKT